MKRALSLLGKFIVAIVVLSCLPLVLPKAFGISVYNVISESMEPTISVGDIVYVKPTPFAELKTGDIIAFNSGASVVTHRIDAIDSDYKLITTKGDANQASDVMPVAYVNVIGKVVAYIPLLGYLAAGYSTIIGKIIAVVSLLVGVILSSVKGKQSNISDKASDAKSKKGRLNPKIVLAIGFVIIVGSLCGFYSIYTDYKQSNDLYDGLNNSIVSKDENVEWYDLVDVDFDALKAINEDVAGWIFVEGTDISYPIMYSGNDSTYLRTTIERKPATAGSIFLEGHNSADFSDSHSIIYGHNMRNLSMFGQLKKYKLEDGYLNEHKYFQVITPNKKMRFEIFSYFDTDAASWVYVIPYSDNQDFADYISKLYNNAMKNIDTKRAVVSADKVVTLSTCSTTGRRFTVHGYMCDVR